MMTMKDAPSANGTAHSRTLPFDDKPRVALGLLSQAYWFAQDAGAELWDFALEIDTLFEARLTISDLRWLVAKGFAEHGQESSVYGGPHRSFRRGDGFFFDHLTCVVLTPDGAAFVGRLLRETVESPKSIQPIEVTSIVGGVTAELDDGSWPDHDPGGTPQVTFKPCWHSTRRELCLNGEVVKRFRVRAQNQEVILSAFEEESWPKHIDDPLPVSGDIDPRTRLHDAINRLNRCQTNRLLRFHGNGTGTGVSWELRQTVVLHQTEIVALRTHGFPTSHQTSTYFPRRVRS